LSFFKQRLDLRRQTLGVEHLLQLAHDIAQAALTIAALQNFRRAVVELHHALGVQQHPAVLRFLVLQAEAARELGALGQGGSH